MAEGDHFGLTVEDLPFGLEPPEGMPSSAAEVPVIDGVPALWTEGTPHTMTLLDAEGNPLTVSTRLAAKVLLWEANAVNHRLETAGDLSTVLAIVDSVAPVP